MPQIKMSPASPRIIKTRPVIASPPDEPLVRGHGDIDYICAGCDRVIAECIELGEIKNLVFEWTTRSPDSAFAAESAF